MHYASTHSSKEELKPRFNSVDIQMLSENLHKKIFKKAFKRELSEKQIDAVIKHLRTHKLSTRDTERLDEVEIKDLPEIYGNNINEHFRHIAKEQTKDYVELMEALALSNLPPIPSKWSFTRGWTKYNSDGSSGIIIELYAVLIRSIPS